MIVTQSGCEIELTDNPNPHILITGRSGSGKTYYCNQLLEEALSSSKHVLVLDFSGSYTLKQLKQGNFHFMDQVCYQDLNKNSVDFVLGTANPDIAANKVTTSLREPLNIKSFIQESLLLECCKSLFQSDRKLTFSDLKAALELKGEEDSLDQRTADGISILLHRLNAFDGLDKLRIQLNDYTEPETVPVTIIQFSHLPYRTGKRAAQFWLSLLWLEIYDHSEFFHYDTLLLDEFQLLSMTEESTLCNMLRESRRFGLQLILSTQYINDYSPAEQNALLQSGTRIYFHPTPKDTPTIAKVICPDNPIPWRGLLNDLSRGKAILTGNYRLKNRGRLISTPILVKVHANNDIL